MAGGLACSLLGIYDFGDVGEFGFARLVWCFGRLCWVFRWVSL